MKYFNNITTPEELKSMWRTYCQTLHPDHGGNAAEFCAMNKEYNEALKKMGETTREEAANMTDDAREYAAALRQAVANDRKDAEALKVGECVHAYDLMSKCNSLGEVFRCWLRYDDDESTEKARTLCRIEAIIRMTDEEANTYQYMNEKPEGCGEGGVHEYTTKKARNQYERDTMAYITAVTLVITPTRFFFIDCEGYDYCRYLLFPLSFRSMFAAEIEAARAANAEEDRKAQEEKERQAAEEIAAYNARCAKWWHLMKKEIPEAVAYNDPEYKATERKRGAAFRSNVLAMCSAAFPGVKFSFTKPRGYWDEYRLEWYDGPTTDELTAATDLDLFCTRYVSGYDMGADYDGREWSTVDPLLAKFAHKWGNAGKPIRVQRVISVDKWQTIEAELLAKFADRLDAYNKPQDYTAFCEILKAYGLESQAAKFFEWCGHYAARDLASVIARNLSYFAPKQDTKSEAADTKTTAKDETTAEDQNQTTEEKTTNTEEKTTEEKTTTTAAEMVDYSAKAFAIFDNLDTLPEEVKAMGRYNRNLTDPRDNTRKAGYIFSKRRADDVRRLLTSEQPKEEQTTEQPKAEEPERHTMTPEETQRAEQLAQLLATVSDIIEAVRECNDESRRVRPDIAAVLSGLFEGAETKDRAQLLATVCAVLAGFYPSHRVAFDLIGCQAWGATSDKLANIWAQLIETAATASRPLGDYLKEYSAAA